MSRLPDLCKELVTDAASYWERMRIAFNIVLAAFSLACWGHEIFSGRIVDFVAGIAVLGVFALFANLCYCSAYPIDFVFQLTSVRAYRSYCRWALFLVGTFFASACALFVLLGTHMA